MATPPPPRPSKRKFTGGLLLESFKRPRPNLQLPSVGAGSVASPAPSAVSTSPSSPSTQRPSAIIPPALAPAHNVSGVGSSTASTSTGSGQVLATAQAGAKSSGMVSELKRATVARLESALQALHISAGAIPGLKPAAAASNAEEYDKIISNLDKIDASLKEYVDELGLEGPSGNSACALIALDIKKELTYIKKKQDRNTIRRALEAIEDKEDVMRCYHRVEELFQQLQGNICLQTLKNTNKQHLLTLLNLLCPVADARYESRHSRTIRRRGCMKKTREQVQADLRSWVEDPNGTKIYWMNGMAGTGKTTIAYSLCEWLETQKRLGASFFCSRVSSLCRDANFIIPTSAYELARYCPAFQRELGKALEKDPHIGTQDVGRQFEKLIQGPMLAIKGAVPQGVVVVIDALDECEDTDCVRLILKALLCLGPNLPLKYFVASRPEPAIFEKMRGLAEQLRAVLHLHDIEQSIVEEDIKKYLEESLGGMLPPPDVKQIDQLARLAGKLFIYAATATRYILPGLATANPTTRLKAIIAVGSSTANKEGLGKKYERLDELYATVLATPLDENILEPEEIEAVQLVLWTVVCAEEPMTVPTLANLLSHDQMRVSLIISTLRSVLHMSESNGLVSALHASFPEYILDRSRSGKFYCDSLQHCALLATNCFFITQTQLRFNICDLKSSYVFDEEVEDLEERVTSNISPELSYACHYWGEHLYRSGSSDKLCRELDDFLSFRLLFWMEVLNLSQRASKGISIIGRAEKWVSDCGPPTLKQLIADSKDFVTRFAAGGCSRSTPYIYISALPFCPKSNSVYALYRRRMRGLIDLQGTASGYTSVAAQATWKTPSDVNSIALSPDGTRIVSGHGSGFILIWDIHTGAALIELMEAHTEDVSSVALSRDGTRIASGSHDKTVRVWDAHAGLSLAGPFVEHTGIINSIAFSPDGMRIASASSDRTIRVWDVNALQVVAEPFQGHTASVNSIAFSPSGTHIASGSDDKTVRLWDSRTANMVAEPFEGHTDKVNAVAFSPSGALIASGSDDHTILLWDPTTGSIVTNIHQAMDSNIRSVAFSLDNSYIVSGSTDSSIGVWDTHNGNVVAGPFRGHTDWVCSVAFCPDGARVVSGSSDSTIRLWDAQKNANIATDRPAQGHTGYIISVALSSDGARVASGSSNKTVRVWDTYTGKAITGQFIGHTESVNSVSFSPDGTRLVSGSSDHTLRLWDAYTGNALAEPLIGHTGPVRSVAFSPDGAFIASGSCDEKVRLWNAYTGNALAEPLMGHTAWTGPIAFSPNSKRVASGSGDHTIRVWSICTSNIAELFVGCMGWIVEGVRFSSDGAHLVSWASGKTFWVWDVATGTCTATVDIEIPFANAVFSPDGTHIATATELDDGHAVLLWGTNTGRINFVAGPFYGHTEPIRSIAFSSDGTHLVSCSEDNTIRVWDLFSNCESFEPSDDGWFTTEDERLFWAPLDLHTHIPHPRNTILITPEGTISIDYDAMRVGNRWAECFDPEQVCFIPTANVIHLTTSQFARPGGLSPDFST